MNRPTYPNVRCLKPGHADEPGYAVCRHVIYDGATITRRTDPTDSTLGTLICGWVPHRKNNDIVIVCAHCCREKGWLTKPG